MHHVALHIFACDVVKFICCCLVCSLDQPARICLVVVSIIGFIGFDMAYTAVVLNYSIECQLMIYYLKNICQRILSKEWAIDEAIRVSCAWIVIQCTRGGSQYIYS